MIILKLLSMAGRKIHSRYIKNKKEKISLFSPVLLHLQDSSLQPPHSTRRYCNHQLRGSFRHLLLRRPLDILTRIFHIPYTDPHQLLLLPYLITRVSTSVSISHRPFSRPLLSHRGEGAHPRWYYHIHNIFHIPQYNLQIRFIKRRI